MKALRDLVICLRAGTELHYIQLKRTEGRRGKHFQPVGGPAPASSNYSIWLVWTILYTLS